MIKMLILLFTLTAQAYANDYFVCTFTDNDLLNAHFNISKSGVSYYENNHLHYHQTFRDSNSDILRSYEWKEELSGNAEIMASNIPRSYGVPFRAFYRDLCNSSTSLVKLTCKRFHPVTAGQRRSVGRP
jgi:hypothetical protein